METRETGRILRRYHVPVAQAVEQPREMWSDAGSNPARDI